MADMGEAVAAGMGAVIAVGMAGAVLRGVNQLNQPARRMTICKRCRRHEAVTREGLCKYCSEARRAHLNPPRSKFGGMF